MRIFFCFVMAVAVSCAARAGEWKSLFNGENLGGWQVVDYGGAGEVKVENEQIVIGMGVALSGVRRTNDLLKTNYEVEVEVMKIDGSDFFCGITFPVQDAHASFIAGGWGGSLVGVSSIDGMDASENEYTQYMRFDDKKWYTIRLRVTNAKIQAWIDGERMLDANIAGKKVSMRPGEIESSVPFGISTFQTTAAIKDVRIIEIPARIPKVAFIAGKKSHGPGEHDYRKSLELLNKKLQEQVEFVDSRVHFDGWPTDEEQLSDADTIVVYSDGSDQDEKNHPLLSPYRLKAIQRAVDRGAGFVALHYTTFVPREKAGDKFLEWVGGYFDYETGTGANKWFSKIETRDFVVHLTDHPIAKGVKPFGMKEEFYLNMRFPEDRKGIEPVATIDPEKKDWAQVVGWAFERPNGGRGFGYTGGHFHKNFEDPNLQKLLLNAILWTARAQ
jgi:type 1 glutamine amidotransferase